MARVEVPLIGDLAILQGETYQALSLTFPGDLSTWTPRGQIRSKLLEESGTLLAEFTFEASTYDADADTTTVNPRLTPAQTTSLPKTKWQGIGEYSKTSVYYYDIELESDTGEVVKSKTAIVQVIGEVTGDGIPPVNTAETFLADPGSGKTGQLLARASDNKGDVVWVNTGHGGLLDADTLDGQEGAYYQDRANHTGTQAISTIDGLQTALDGKEPADSTILKSANIGVTVQPYDANLVSDANYVATENSYTTTEKNKLAGIESGATADQTPAELLTAIKTVDGTGSGLDADTLDGLEATAFATAAQGALANSALQPETIGVTVQAYDANTVVDPAYVHTDNNYTDAEKGKLAGIADGAEVNVKADWNAVSGDAQILNKPDLSIYAETTAVNLALAGKEDADPTILKEAAIGVTVQPFSLHTVIDSEYSTVKQKAQSALQSGDIANFETTTQLNSRDTANRNRANHSGTQSISTIDGLQTALNNKQDTLSSGTNIKTINSQSVLGSGNIETPGINNPVATVFQSIQAVTYNQGGNSTLNNSTHNVFALNANGTGTTIAHSNVPASGNRYGFELHLNWTTGTITWPASWAKGDSPPTAVGSYVISGVTVDGGVSWKIAILAE